MTPEPTPQPATTTPSPEPGLPHPDPKPRSRGSALLRPSRWAGTLSVTSVLAAALIRVLHRGWAPSGDIATIALHTRDVFGSHHLLTGLPSSASGAAGHLVFSPGPLLFTYLAPWQRLLGDGALPAAAVTCNLGCAIGVIWSLTRTVPPTARPLVPVVVSWFAWQLGDALLTDLWAATIVVWPCLLCATAALAATRGHTRWAPISVVAGSFAVQANLSSVGVVPMAWALAAWGLWNTRRIREGRRMAVVTIAAGVLCWLEPLADQFFGSHNLWHLLSAHFGGDHVGIGRALGVAVRPLTVAPWTRDQFPLILGLDEIPGVRTIGLVGFVALAFGVWSWWHRWSIGRVGSAVVLLIAGQVLVVSRLFLVRGFEVMPMWFARTLVPLAAIWALCVVAGLWAGKRPLVHGSDDGGPVVLRIRSIDRALTAVCFTATALFTMAALPPFDAGAAMVGRFPGEEAARLRPLLASAMLRDQVGGSGTAVQVRLPRTAEGFFASVTLCAMVEDLGHPCKLADADRTAAVNVREHRVAGPGDPSPSWCLRLEPVDPGVTTGRVRGGTVVGALRRVPGLGLFDLRVIGSPPTGGSCARSAG